MNLRTGIDMNPTVIRKRAFTLVEMLVVIAIIGVLVALLLPAVVGAINNARRARMALEISQLANAVEAYKAKFGDYPPNFRSHDVFIRHVRKCFRKIHSNPDPMNPGHLELTEQKIWGTNDFSMGTPTPNIDESEALVMWLTQINSDPRQPFTYLTTGSTPANRVNLYDIDLQRITDADSDGYPSYKPAYAGDTAYIHIDSRSYPSHNINNTSSVVATAEGGFMGSVRPYYDSSVTTGGGIAQKPSSFQILCAGQDGVFGADPTGTMTDKRKFYPSGINYQVEDRDNITNFSEGKRLGDAIPQ